MTETAGFFSFTHDGTVTMNAYVNKPPNASKTFGSANAGVRDGSRPSIANWPTNSVVKAEADERHELEPHVLLEVEEAERHADHQKREAEAARRCTTATATAQSLGRRRAGR